MVWAVVSLDPKCSLLMACLRTLENFESSDLVSLFFFCGSDLSALISFIIFKCFLSFFLFVYKKT